MQHKQSLFLLVAAILCAGQHAIAAPTWVADKGGHAPAGAIAGGTENGRPLVVCRASYQNGVHPGKLVGSNCNIGWGGREITLPGYEVLTGNAAEIKWEKGQNGSVPANAFIGGKEPGRTLPVCRVNYNGGVHPGKIVAKNCNIGWGGREITVPSYEVMVIAAAEPVKPVSNISFSKTWSWNITSTSGGLSMSMNNGNMPTKVHFVYGTNSNLSGGTTVGASSLPAISGGVQSHAELKGLKPGTTYYFKAYGSNASGASESAMGQFDTLKPAPPAISGISHSTITYNGVLLSMNMQSNDAGTANFLYSTVSNMSNAKEARSQTFKGGATASGSHHDLTPNLQGETTYYYQAVVTNQFGTTKSGIQSFKTAAGGPKAPTFTRTWSWEVKPDSAGLSMSINNYGISAQVYFLYGTDANLTGATKVAQSNLNGYATGVQSHATLKGLKPQTTYYYRAVATSSAGTAQSGIQSFRTP